MGSRKGKPVAGLLAGIMFGTIGVIVSFLLRWSRVIPCKNQKINYSLKLGT